MPSAAWVSVGIVRKHPVKSTWTKCMKMGSRNARAVDEVSFVTRLAPNVTAMNMRPVSVAAAAPVSM